MERDERPREMEKVKLERERDSRSPELRSTKQLLD